ncbi:MAG: endoflagellar filament sheath protein [Candidatus Hydrogenedentota bacterium]|nr:MAG: endoflagellar filament sheath protein [Candidatus Hydrogenedentota bacterium]
MKVKIIKYGLISLAAVLLSSGLTARLQTPIGDDVDAMELRSIVVEGWEKQPWEATTYPPPPLSKVEVNLVTGKPKNLGFDKSDVKSMGLRFSFVYPGYNKVTLTPPKDKIVERPIGQLDKDNKPIVRKIRGIELPGKVKAVSVWVLGRANEYTLEGWIEDWTGDTHIYHFGSLDFVGWRPLTIQIPESVPQDIDSYPQTKTLVFKKFVIRSTPETSMEPVVLFFDSLKVLTDMYDVYFDGADLDFDAKDREYKERLKKYADQLRKYSSAGNK